MRKKLLSLLTALLVSSAFVNAQTTTWNFSNAEWPVSGGYAAPTVVNNLGFITGTTTTMGAVENNTATFDGYSFTKRLKFNGGSYAGGTTDFAMPTQRAMYFDVNGNSTITIWYKNGGGGDRTLYVTNGTSVIKSFLYNDSTVGQVATTTYTGSATRIYIAADQAMNVYQITATNVGTTATLATAAVTKSTSNVFASGNQVFVNNLKSATQIDVYTANGSLVKSVNAKSDTSFQLNSGFYIVNLKSAAGSTSKKVLVK
ncbi:T9SS type A sorting domain-containing protein [Kaistella flava (ex Peng et al. 2021)]|uniref:T9SS type A sorting domain-containing protein n=1 Tax=Kaistella flava (ex Peng et al. 2021) TaxID=2038776 RepID=A0A7M2Y9B9_9FLAO|nr:T9SS type A sorting domain-containing protein [Kaistella flava (ex Peng et al. 2021)]QOW10429.1 T9SS type A sorting domain-containing protein [Kaistella flava (ex Peng et al. 2021)]